MRFTILALTGAALLTLASCGGGEETARVDESDRRAGAEQHAKLLSQFGGAYEGPEALYLKEIGQKLATAAGYEGDCTFTLVNTDVVNAFAVQGCYIYVTRGLMALMNSEAQLAAVLGHELGHIASDHIGRQQRRSILRQLGVLAVGLATDSPLLTHIAGGAAQFLTLRYSRTHEHEADDFAVRTLIATGYDPYDAAEMLESLTLHEQFEAASGGPDLNRIPEWGRTHPLNTNRIERVRAAAKAANVTPDELPENERKFLNEVRGLLYGDDPQQGFVLGRRFAHPRMRIAFEVPSGFRLTNTPDAVLIEGPDGIRGQFSAGPMAEGDLDGFARSVGEQAFGRGAELSPPSRTMVNGFQASLLPVRLNTSEGAVEALVAAYAAGPERAYYFLLVGPPGQPLPQGAMEMIGSLSSISRAEADRLQTRVVDVVQVPAGGDLDRLASLMASDRPLAKLRMLNGLDEGDRLTPGQPVKIVRYGAPER